MFGDIDHITVKVTEANVEKILEVYEFEEFIDFEKI
jgi:hypothetical protein